MSMNYVVRQVGNVTILDLSGRISLGEALAIGPASALLLHDVIRAQVTSGRNQILLNIGGITYIDSSGLGELVSALSTVKHHGGQMRICNASERINDLARMTHLDSILSFDKDESTALRAFSAEQSKTSAA